MKIFSAHLHTLVIIANLVGLRLPALMNEAC